QVNGEVWNARHRTIHAQELCQRLAVVTAHEHATADAEIAIEPRRQDDTAVDLDAPATIALAVEVRPRLEPQIRRVGVRAEQAEAGRRRWARPGAPGDEGARAAHEAAGARNEGHRLAGLVELC